MFKNILLLVGFSTFVVFAIIAFNIYHARTTSTIPPITQKYSTPIDSSFDMETLQALKNRNAIPIDLQSKSGVITQDEIDATQGATQSIQSVQAVPATPAPTVPIPAPATQSAGQTPSI